MGSLILVILLLLNTYVYAENCTPTNCLAICTPVCTPNEVCTLGTMTACGVCPNSQCLPRSFASNIPDPNNSNSPTMSSAGLIGGIIGGIIGGGLLLSGLGYLFIRHRNKKIDKLKPFSYNMANNTSRQMEQAHTSVIPTISKPSKTYSIHSSHYSEAETPKSHIASFSTFAHQTNRRSVSNASSIVANTDCYKRDSIETHVSHPRSATVAQATQIIRAKPQIVRVNTVVVPATIGRKGSVKKTIKLENNEQLAAVIENPFDDKNTVYSRRISRIDNPTTDSLVSNADGEITIFFNAVS